MMSMPGGLRFSLAQSMAVTAVVAVLFAFSDRYGSSYWARFWVSTAVHFVGAGVCLYNLRLSRGMWLMLVGYLGPWFVDSAARLVFAVWSSRLTGIFLVNVGRVTWVANTAFSLLFVAGLAVT